MNIGKTRTNQPVESSKELDDVLENAGGSKLYNHRLAIEDDDDNTYYFEIVNNSQEPIDTLTKLINAMKYNTGLGTSTKYRIYLGYNNTIKTFITKIDDTNYLVLSQTLSSLNTNNSRPLIVFHDAVDTL